MPATPQPASKMTGGPGNVPTDLSKTAHGPLGSPKSTLRETRERPRAPSGPPSDTPRSSPEPPRREYANGCRGSTNSGRPARAPGTPWWTQPQGMIVYVLTLPHSSSRLLALSGLPPRRTLGVGGLTGLRPLPPTPKEDLAVSNMRTARSDFSYEYLDEEFNPRQMMLNQDESCSRQLSQLPR